MASRMEADVPPLQPELFLRGPGAVAGPLEAVPVHLEDRLPQIGFLGVGERFIPRQDPLPEVVHVRGGSVVKPAAIAKPILVDLKVDPRVILGVHPAAPLENQPQMVPVQGLSLIHISVAIDGADNAAILACQMLALSDEALAAQLAQMKADMAQGVEKKNAALQEKVNEL